MKIFPNLRNLDPRICKKPEKFRKLMFIEFEANDACQRRDQIYDAQGQQFVCQVNLNRLASVLSNSTFSQVRAVSIHEKASTSRKELVGLIEALFDNLPKLSFIRLNVDSFDSSQAIERLNEIGQTLTSYVGHFDVGISLHGTGDVHDKIRGWKGNFENTVKVIDFVRACDFVSSYRLKCKIVKENIYSLHDLLEFSLGKNIFVQYELGHIERYLHSKDTHNNCSISFEEKYHIAVFLENLNRFYEKSEQQQIFYRSLINQLMYQKPHASRCDRRDREATLSAGGVLYCAGESKISGSTFDRDSEGLDLDGRKHLANIVQTNWTLRTNDGIGFLPTEVLQESDTKHVFRKLRFSSKMVKEFKFLAPVKQLKNQLDFHKRLKTIGVNQTTLDKPQPAVRFTKSYTGKRKVLICGWYGTETLGDKAILGGVINSLQEALGDFELHIASIEVYISQVTALQMPELKGCVIHSIADAVRLAHSMDLVVFGGGPLMAIEQLAEMIVIFQKAVEAQVPTLIAGCGVGPLGKPHHNQAVKWLLKHASHRIYRDQKSMQVAHSLGIDTSKDQVAEDPAFTWLETCASESQALITAKNNRPQEFPTLLLGLRDWPHEQYAPELDASRAKQLKLRFEKEVIVGLERLLNRYPNLKIIPFPMCTNHIGSDDRWFYRDLFRNHPHLQKSLDLSYLGSELSPLDAIDIFKSASAALTMRFHSLVFALATDIPTVSIDYTLGHGKVKALAEKYNVPQMSLDAIDSEFIFSSLSTLFAAAPCKSTSFWQNKKLFFKTAMDSAISLLNQ